MFDNVNPIAGSIVAEANRNDLAKPLDSYREAMVRRIDDLSSSQQQGFDKVVLKLAQAINQKTRGGTGAGTLNLTQHGVPQTLAKDIDYLAAIRTSLEYVFASNGWGASSRVGIVEEPQHGRATGQIEYSLTQPK